MSFPNGVVPTNQRVHPTPLYELFAWMLIAYVLWRLGARFLQQKRSAGLVFCVYLRSRASHVFWLKRFASTHGRFSESSNAQAASVASVLLDSSSTSWSLGIECWGGRTALRELSRLSPDSLFVNNAFLHYEGYVL